MTKISRAGWDLSYLPYLSRCNQEPEEPQGTPESPACRQLDPPPSLRRVGGGGEGPLAAVKMGVGGRPHVLPFLPHMV